MTSLHPDTRTAASPSLRIAAVASVDAPVHRSRRDVVAALDLFADDLQDGIDLLGTRASGPSLAAAARRLSGVLADVTRLTARGDSVLDPVPAELRIARGRLRDADMELADIAYAARELVPMRSSEQAKLDLRMCGWVDAARLLATWLDEVATTT